MTKHAISHFANKANGWISGIAIAALGLGIPYKYPTAPKWVSDSLILWGVVALIAVSIVRVGKWLAPKLPRRPWFPENPFQWLAWLKLRPHLSFVTMSAKDNREKSGMVTESRLTLTLYQCFEQVAGAKFDYGPATLEITQSTRGERRKYYFRPGETGGLLSLRQSVRMSGVQIEFAWTGVPAWPDHAPDLSAAFEWKLSGVWATLHGPRQISGILPSLRGYWPSAGEMLHVSGQAVGHLIESY